MKIVNGRPVPDTGTELMSPQGLAATTALLTELANLLSASVDGDAISLTGALSADAGISTAATVQATGDIYTTPLTVWQPTITVTAGGTAPVYNAGDFLYRKVGKTVFLWGFANGDGGAEGAGAGALLLTLPVATSATLNRNGKFFGYGWILNGTTYKTAFCELYTTTTMSFYDGVNSARITGADQDNAARLLNFFGTYEAAS